MRRHLILAIFEHHEKGVDEDLYWKGGSKFPKPPLLKITRLQDRPNSITQITMRPFHLLSLFRITLPARFWADFGKRKK